MDPQILNKQLMKHYKLRPTSIKAIGTIYKTIAVYKVHTNHHIYCVKPFPYTKEHFRLLIRGLTFLQSKHYQHSPVVYQTKSGKFYFILQDKQFYVTEWYNGKTCDFHDMPDIRNVVQALATLHKTSSEFTNKYPSYKNRSKQYLQSLIHRHTAFMKRISKLKQAADFHPDIERLLNDSDPFIQAGEQSTHLLKTYLSEDSYKQHECFCHNDLTSYNCMYDHNGMIKFIDFDNCRISNRIYDFSFFLANTMGWSWDHMKYAIEIYGKIHPWTKDSLHVLNSCLMLPKEFWYITVKWHNAVKNADKKVFEQWKGYFMNTVESFPKKQACLAKLQNYIDEM